jgi:putative addiction module antidote
MYQNTKKARPMKPVKVTTVGNSIGIVLNEELRAALGVGKGDMLYPTRTPDGIALHVYDAAFADQMKVLETLMHEDRDVLHELAKR